MDFYVNNTHYVAYIYNMYIYACFGATLRSAKHSEITPNELERIIWNIGDQNWAGYMQSFLLYYHFDFINLAYNLYSIILSLFHFCIPFLSYSSSLKNFLAGFYKI